VNTYPQAQGQIVKMVNVGTEKSFRCWVDFPAELAERMIAEFGWASNVKPIPVVMAGLTDAGGMTSTPPSREARGQSVPTGVVPASRLTQMACICCNDPVFWRYLDELGYIVTNKDHARKVVYELCDVDSRKEFIIGTPAGDRWLKFYDRFALWRDAPGAVA
jgi:hypothetical protein